MHYLNESHILLFLVQVFVLLLFTRGFGEVLHRWKQPVLTAELLVGVVLGPTILARLLPGVHQALFPNDAVQQSMLETVAWVGVLFLLLDTGMEIDFSIAWRQRGNALLIAISDILIPMAVAFVPAVLLPDRFLVRPEDRVAFALFMATVMTISAMPVAARVMHDLNLLKTDMGFLTMSALAVNDIIGWALFTIVLGMFTRTGAHGGSVLRVLVATIGFTVLALGIGRRLSTRALEAMRRGGLREPASSFTFACLLGLLFGAATQKLGIHALFGFFIAGVVVGEAKGLSEETRRIISQMVHALFVPLFFANVGLKIDFVASFNVWLVTLVTVVGIGGRYLGAWIGVTFTKVPRINRNLIAIAHTPGGMMEVVVAVLALESGLITQPVFVAIVFSAVFSSVILGPWLAKALARRSRISLTETLSARSATLLAATTREDAVSELAAIAAGQIALPTERITAAVLEREAEFGTAIGDHVAIPHARIDGIAAPVLVYGRATPGLDWNAPDGQAVQHVFLLVVPTGAADLHVQILAMIAGAMRAETARTALQDAADARELEHRITQIFSLPGSPT